MIMVNTKSGIIMIDYENLIEYGIIPTVDPLGNNVSAIGMFFYNNFAFLTLPVNNTSIAIQITSLNYANSSLYCQSINYTNLTLNGHWIIFYNPKYEYYLRIDYNEVRVYQFQVQLPRIIVSSTEENYEYTITAKDVYNSSASSNLTIYDASKQHYNISNTYMGKPFNSVVNYQYSFIENNLTIDLPTYMFSG